MKKNISIIKDFFSLKHKFFCRICKQKKEEVYFCAYALNSFGSICTDCIKNKRESMYIRPIYRKTPIEK